MEMYVSFLLELIYLFSQSMAMKKFHRICYLLQFQACEIFFMDTVYLTMLKKERKQFKYLAANHNELFDIIYMTTNGSAR